MPRAEGGSIESRGTALGLIAAADLESQAAAVADEIARVIASGVVRDRQTGVARRAAAGDVAILFRTRDGHQAFQRALEQRGIPSYVYKGLGFFDADEVKDVFALLRYLANPVSELRAAAFLRSRFVRLSDVALVRLAPELAAAMVRPTESDGDLDADDRAVLTAVRRVVPAWLALADRDSALRVARPRAGPDRLRLRARQPRRRASASPGARESQEGARAGAPHREPRLRHAGARGRLPRSAVGGRRVGGGRGRHRLGEPDDRARGQGPGVPGRVSREPRTGRRRRSRSDSRGAHRARRGDCGLGRGVSLGGRRRCGRSGPGRAQAPAVCRRDPRARSAVPGHARSTTAGGSTSQREAWATSCRASFARSSSRPDWRGRTPVTQ